MSVARYMVRIDYENNAEEFWENLPLDLDRKIGPYGEDGGILTAEEIERIKRVPGWDRKDAPPYARYPLIFCPVTME